MKNKNFTLLLSVFSLIIIMIGATFSYFTIMATSGENAVNLAAATIGLEVGISPLYTDKDLIPMDDDDVMTGYEHQCVDVNSYGACQAYQITVNNTGDSATYEGSINFSINDIMHLNYLLLDENDDVYVANTPIVSGTDQTLGDEFTLGANESRTFTLVIWLSNYEYLQEDEDGGGSFSALVTYASTTGSRITGTFSVSG